MRIVSVRIPDEFFEEINKWAEENKVTRSQQVIKMLEYSANQKRTQARSGIKIRR